MNNLQSQLSCLSSEIKTEFTLDYEKEILKILGSTAKKLFLFYEESSILLIYLVFKTLQKFLREYKQDGKDIKLIKLYQALFYIESKIGINIKKLKDGYHTIILSKEV